MIHLHLPDAAHVVFDHVDDDGKIHAPASRARARARLRNARVGSSSVRLSNRRVLSAGSFFHRRAEVFFVRVALAGFRVRENRVRGSRAPRIASARIFIDRAARHAAFFVGTFFRAARAVRAARGSFFRRRGRRRVRQRDRRSGRRRWAHRERRACVTSERDRDRHRGSRRGIRRSRRTLPWYHGIRRASPRAARRRGARRARRSRRRAGADDRSRCDDSFGGGNSASGAHSRTRSRRAFERRCDERRKGICVRRDRRLFASRKIERASRLSKASGCLCALRRRARSRGEARRVERASRGRRCDACRARGDGAIARAIRRAGREPSGCASSRRGGRCDGGGRGRRFARRRERRLPA